MLCETIKRWKNVILLCLLIFLVGVTMGIISGYLKNYNAFKPEEARMKDIFLNNIKTCIFIIVSGLLTGGILSSLVLLINGYIIGLVIYGVMLNYGLVPLLTGLMPHFFIELTAIVFCATIGFMSSIYFFMYIGKLNRLPFSRFVKDGFILILVSVLLLLSASWIEDYISRVTL
ncbi:stage II sporulation protein M [Bacillus smithii]|uniref:stage II sporulation protein M n=1 Tax=Bacillus smithii TaxID=1479 RepID=UPI002E24A09D|nr:stage II sporulation protein M [Bacillus smithii]